MDTMSALVPSDSAATNTAMKRKAAIDNVRPNRRAASVGFAPFSAVAGVSELRPPTNAITPEMPPIADRNRGLSRSSMGPNRTSDVTAAHAIAAIRSHALWRASHSRSSSPIGSTCWPRR